MGRAFLFAFPFWIYVDTDHPPATRTLEYDGVTVRLYPPFRSAPANYLPLPTVDPDAMPLPAGAARTPIPAHHRSAFAAIPLLLEPGMDTCSVKLEWGPSWGADRPRAFPMDSLRVDVLAGTPAEAEAHAADLVSRLLAQLRFQSRQWWIDRSAAVFGGYLRHVYAVDGVGTVVLPGSSARYASVRTVDGTERALDARIWEAVVSAVEARDMPPIARLLLLDARYHGAAGDVRLSVLDAATGVEQAKDGAFERLWVARNPNGRFKRGRVLSGYDVGEHLDADMRRLVGRSFRDEHEDSWVAVADLWDARGNVAHGAPAVSFRRADVVVPIDGGELARMLQSAAQCLDWLDAL